MNDITKKWIEAGKALISDPIVKVECPECGKATLAVQDIYDESNPVEIRERMIYCPLCKAKQFILKPRKMSASLFE